MRPELKRKAKPATTDAISIAQMPVRPRYQNIIRVELSIRKPMAVRQKDTKLIASEIIITPFNSDETGLVGNKPRVRFGVPKGI